MRWRLNVEGYKEPVEVTLLSARNDSFVFKVGKEAVTLSKAEVSDYFISTDEIKLPFEVWNSKKWRASVGAETYLIEPIPFGKDSAGAQGEIKSEMPGRILKILVKAGDKISANQPLVIMEAMKMENEIRASGDATVKSVSVKPGDSVESGAVLIELKQ